MNNPLIRILRSYYGNRGKYTWLLQKQHFDHPYTQYITIGETRFRWRLNWWKRRFGVEDF